MNNKRSLEQWL